MPDWVEAASASKKGLATVSCTTSPIALLSLLCGIQRAQISRRSLPHPESQPRCGRAEGAHGRSPTTNVVKPTEPPVRPGWLPFRSVPSSGWPYPLVDKPRLSTIASWQTRERERANERQRKTGVPNPTEVWYYGTNAAAPVLAFRKQVAGSFKQAAIKLLYFLTRPGRAERSARLVKRLAHPQLKYFTVPMKFV